MKIAIAAPIPHLTGPEPLSTEDLCARISQVTGQPVAWPDASDEDHLAARSEGGEPEPFARLLLTLCRDVCGGHCDVASTDIERLTGRAPEPFEAFARRRLQQRD